MKTIKSYTILLCLLAFFIAGCSLEAPTEKRSVLNIGDADFSRYVALGDGITAGFQSSALTAIHQAYSYPQLIAQQTEVETFVQPLLDYPGIGLYTEEDMAGIQELVALDGPIIEPASYSNYPNFNLLDPYISSDIKNHAAPYNNLGVPLAFVYDIMNATSRDMCYTGVFAQTPNSFFDIVLRNPGFGNTTPFQQAEMLQPTFVTTWIGKNDVFIYCAYGGTSPTTPLNLFSLLYGGMMDALASLGAQLVVANIPDVTAFPLFTTIPHVVDVPGVGSNIPLIIETGSGVRQATANDRIILTAMDVIGDVTGDYGPAGVPVGLNENAPLPSAFVLDQDEVSVAQQAVSDYNGVIASTASDHSVPVVDMYEFYNNLTTNGYTAGGLDFSTDFISGGIFSLDGAHPTDVGQALIANEFIKVINDEFNAQIPLVNIIEITE
jgi:lysophospholipase L1-like esterase